MRDTRKDELYFRSFIDSQNKRIARKEEKIVIAKGNPAKINRICISLIKYKMDLLIASFSLGAEREEIEKLFASAADTLCSLDTIDYETLLNALSIAIILDDIENGKRISAKHKDYISKDKLLKLLSEYLCDCGLTYSGTFLLPDVYMSLNDIYENTNKTLVLESYLSTWYCNRETCSWYDSHKNGKDTYYGYWSFEAAALVKIFKLDDTNLRLNEYYPYM